MAIEVFNRYEKKYLLDEKTYQKLIKMLDHYMEPDKFNKNNEFYSISNIYYDTPTDELIRASIQKPVYKEKLRLRSYGVPGLQDEVFLEIKKKFKGVVNKRRTRLLLQEAYDYVDCHIRPDEKPYINKQVLNEIDFFLNHYELVPKLYLAYDRKAYFGCEDPGFRVTFDTNIRTRREELRLEAGNHGEPLIGNGLWLMEVKILGGAPVWFTKILSECEVFSTSFSKYGTEYRKQITEIYKEEGEESLCLDPFLKQPQKQHYHLVHQF